MPNYTCKNCSDSFTDKKLYKIHKNTCVKCIDYSKQTRAELIKICKEKRIKGYSKINKDEIIKLICPILDKQLIKDAVIVRKEGLDKFYTIPSYSKICIDKLFELYTITDFDLIIEPSAGNGSFYNQIDSVNKIGIDILPEDSSIIKQDFFTYRPPLDKKNILVIGNPPFGKISSIAIKFFNHSSKWANVIAFIIPRTFRRFSVQNKLNNNFHLIYDSDVPLNPCCFTPKLNVKCCFQIWHRQNNIRPVINLEKKHDDWDFLAFGPLDKQNQPTPPNNADFAILAYGGKIGKIEKNNLNNLRPKSWHWIKCNIEEKELINRFNKLDYSNGLNTARQNSIGRGELVKLYSDFINSKS